MKKLICFLLFSVSSFVSAQSVKTLKLDCYPLKDLAVELSKYNEVPLLIANSVRPSGNNTESSALIIFINTETRTWSILERDNENYCILAIGDQIIPVSNKKPR